VRALTRNPESSQSQSLAQAGAELVAADLDDIGSVTDAARGVDAIFAMATPFEAGPEAEVRQGPNIVTAAEAAG